MEKLLDEKQPSKAVSRFGAYRLLRPLKRSPFLENHLAQTESPPHAVVVLKRLHPLVVHRTDWVALFLDEVKQAAGLWHPNIIRIYDLGEVDGVPYFVQPYLFGKKLETLLARSRSLPIPTGMALLLLRQLLDALHVAHGLRGHSARPVVHGGLHPERIFIGYDGVVRVGDFGLGWLEDPRSAIRSRYRTPESILERKGGEIPGAMPGEDLFAASAILCELLGEFPEPVKPGMDPWGFLPASIRSILLRGLAIDPAARFQTAAEMIVPIEAILQSEYPRLSLTNYIQAFFGKEIEAERRAFARFAPIEWEGACMGATPILERAEAPALLASQFPEPVPSIPEASSQPPSVSAVMETVVDAPATPALPDGGEPRSLPVAPPEEKASPWQPIWWGLFGLLMTGFVAVLFFSLYRSSSDQDDSVPVAPPPGVEAQGIDPPPSILEENAPSPEEIAPALSAEPPASSEPPPPVASVAEPIKAPSSFGEKLERDQAKRSAVAAAPHSASLSVAAPSGVTREAPPVAVHSCPK